MFRFRTNPGMRAPLTAGRSSTFGYLLAAGVGLVVALFVLMAFSASRGDADRLPDLYKLPRDAQYPEGITADNESGTFYVSSVADGSIYRGNVSDNKVELFLPGGEDGRTNATGLKLDDGHLFVAGAGTGKVFIYDTSSGDLIRSFDTEGAAGFLNDLAINPQTGDAYITDSFVPTLWRISGGKLKPWLDLTKTPIQYTDGSDGSNPFNLNGIVATPDGRYLLTVQSNTGNLYRIDTQTKQVSLVEGLGEQALLNGDGLVLKGDTLYVVRNQGLITKVSLDSLDGEPPSGHVEGDTLVPFPEDFPTTAALVGTRLLVVNSQFNTEGGPVGGTTPPEIPFTVSAMPAP
jgi:Cu-Zn family superoxide dismutase